MKISIIIPVFRDWDRLKLTLSALNNQSLPKEDFEILIVNNGVNSDIPENFNFPINSKVLLEEKPGSYAARNLGVKLSKGELLAFTDSDCIPDPKWLENGLKYFHDKNLDRLGGAISIFCQNDSNKTPAELYDVIFAFQQKKAINKVGYSVTANLLVRRSSFMEVGAFNDSLYSGGDHEWNIRANEKGLSLIYAPDVIVNHPARKTIEDLEKKVRRVMGSWKIPDGFLKRVYKRVYMILSKMVKPLLIVLKTRKLTFGEKVEVIKVILHLYFVSVDEYNRLIKGGKAKRA